MCSYSQLGEVLRIYNIFLSDNDVKFLASQYIVSGRTQEVHYQKLMDDVRNAERAENGHKTTVGDPNTICGAIAKQLHVLSLPISDYF